MCRAPLVILLSENHVDEPAIWQNLRTGLRLIDAGVVDFVGVEGTPEGVPLEAGQFARRFGSLSFDGFTRELRARSEDDAGIIAAMRTCSRKLLERMSFARTLLCLQPAVAIETVEDPLLHAESEAAYAKLDDECCAAPEETRTAAIQAFAQSELQRQRDRAFVANLLSKRQSFRKTRAAILNAGTNHQRRIVAILPPATSFIQVKPDFSEAIASFA